LCWKEKSEVPKKDKVILILEASVKVFADDGYESARIEDIAREAGIGKGTLYGYFSSKEELFRECIRYYIKKYYDYMAESVKSHTGFREKLLAFSRSRGEFLERHFDFTRLILITAYNLPMHMKTWMLKSKLEVDMLLKNTIKKAVDEGELSPGLDVDLAVSCLIGSYNQYCLKKIFIDGERPSHIDPVPLVDLLLKGWT
jgi:AcrR family transcriptional regulator